MKQHKTLPELASVLKSGMTHWMERGEHQEVWDLDDGPYRYTITDAIAEQNAIGWNNALKGRLSTIWGKIYMQHVQDTNDDIPVHLSATWWTGEVIRQILYFSLAIWQHRNDYLHNKEAAEDRINQHTEAL